MLGLCLAAQSVLDVSGVLLGEEGFRYVLPYKLSQDHVELLFSRIRRMGGLNNNPNAVQLQHALRRLALHNFVSPSATGNSTTQADGDDGDGDIGLLRIRRPERQRPTLGAGAAAYKWARGVEEPVRFFRLFDAVGDVLNAANRGDRKELRRGYSATAKQEAVLDDAMAELLVMRVGKARHLYAFQRGWIVTIRSLRDLLEDLKQKFGPDTYLLTRRLTQVKKHHMTTSARNDVAFLSSSKFHPFKIAQTPLRLSYPSPCCCLTRLTSFLYDAQEQN